MSSSAARAAARPPTLEVAKPRIVWPRRRTVTRLSATSDCVAVTIAPRGGSCSYRIQPRATSRGDTEAARAKRDTGRLRGSLAVAARRFRARRAPDIEGPRPARHHAAPRLRLQGRRRLRRRAEAARASDAGELRPELRDPRQRSPEPPGAQARRPERPQRVVAPLGRVRIS